jgi:hypothetical protein
MDERTKLLIAILDAAFDKPSWHGPNLMASVRRVNARDASWAPAGRKSVWEQVLHAAYWKQRVLNRVAAAADGAPRGSRSAPFPRSPANWPRVPDEPSDRAFRADLQLLDDIHKRLRAAVARLGARGPIPPKLLKMIYGAAAHDVYHAGQINLLRRLRER